MSEASDPITQKLTYSIKEVAAVLGIGINNAYELVRSGRLRSVRVGRRLLIPKRELEDFLIREAN